MEQHQQRRKRDREETGAFCRRFGSAAVQLGFVTAGQLQQAMSEQVDDDLHHREHRLLGTILHDHGWLSEDQIGSVLRDLRSDLA